MECSGFHGLTLFAFKPKALPRRSLNNSQVEGMNCEGPIPPPYPLLLLHAVPGGQETGVIFQSLPSRSVISLNGTVSRGAFITCSKNVPVFLPAPSPVSRFVIRQEPTFLPRSDSW